MHYRSTIGATLLASVLVFFACQPESGESSRRTVNGKGPAGNDGGTTEGGSADGGATEGGSTEGGSAEGGATEGGSTEGGMTEGADLDLFDPNEATWHQDAKKILDDYCLDCHVTQLPAMDTYDAAVGVADYIKDSVIAGTMPPAGSLPEEEKSTLVGWILAGTRKGADLKFINPTTDAAANEAEFEIGVEIDAPSDAKWSLYYTQTVEATTGGTAIASDLGMDVLSVQWNVTAVPAGVYYIYAEVKIGDKTYAFKGPGKISVSIPVITLAQAWKNGETGFVQTPSLTLPYTVSGTLPGGSYHVRIQYKRGVGGTWIQAADDAGLTGYVLPALDEGDDYYFKVTLLQDGQDRASDETTKLIAIASSNYSFAGLPGNCAGCHPGNGRVVEKNPETLNRIKGVGNVMPQSGLMNDDDQLRVRLWFWLTYQN